MKITITIKNEKIIATDKTIKEIVKNEIKRLGLTADLNHIDTSKVTDMSYLFYGTIFDGDISNWDVSNVENMNYMFYNSQFNQDISKWNINLKILKEVPLNFDNNAVDNNNFLLLLFNSFKDRNKIKFKNLSRKIYINHIRKRLKI